MTCPYFDEKENKCTIKEKWDAKDLEISGAGGCLWQDGKDCDYANAEMAVAPEKVTFT